MTTHAEGISTMDSDTMKIHPPALAGMVLLAALGLNFLVPAIRVFHWPHHFLAMLVVAAGTAIMVSAASIFNALGTTKNPYGEPATFIRLRPYTFTRNPMYLGLTMVLLGLALYVGSMPMFLAPLAFFFVIDRMVIPREEATMERTFGANYTDYKARVRRWL
jgi:protein-S-isoprenylcysteine O-methyltransferase Ste14